MPFITKVVNFSLEHGVLATDMDSDLFKNYRQVSNLMFLSKFCEKIVASQLNNYLSENSLHELFQSAYKTGHSTEFALIRVENDVLRAIDDDRCVILLLLDLSVASDTIDHEILLSRLSNC